MFESKNLIVSEYLESLCLKIKEDMPDEVFTCDIYAGQLSEGATNGLNFNVKKGCQLYLTLDSMTFPKGEILIGEATFVLYCAALPSINTRGFSLEGLNAVQKIIGYINEQEYFMQGLMTRPEFQLVEQMENKEKSNRLYNIFKISYRQRIMLNQS